MRLETKRLTLREWKKTDTNALINILNNLKVSKWLIFVKYPYTNKDAEKDIKDSIKRSGKKEREDYNLAIELKSEKKVIGEMELVNVDKFQEKAEIDYWLGEEYWGKGFGSEALEKTLQFAFEDLKLRKVEARVFVGNPSSGKLLEKFGFKKEGVRKKSYRCKADNKIKDEIVYGLLKEGWKKLK